jgi:hypothetical protein
MLKVIFILQCQKVKELRVPFVMYSFHEILTHMHTQTYVLLKCICMYNAVINTSLFLSSSAFQH